MDYIKIIVQIHPREPWGDLFIDELAGLGCDSFEETEKGFNAYLPIGDDLAPITDFLDHQKISDVYELEYSTNEIQTKNWNEVWESNFEPIYVDDFCCISAPFHKSVNSTQFNIVIEPKMSFGTGHHETTYMMIKSMQKLDLKNKYVLDMGCGTGVLGILAQKLSAKSTIGIDIESWAVENAIENCAKNNVEMQIVLGGKEHILDHQFDVILANINRNILIDQLPTYSKVIAPNGSLLMSGFLLEDEEVIVKNANQSDFKLIGKMQKNNWLCLEFEKS